VAVAAAVVDENRLGVAVERVNDPGEAGGQLLPSPRGSASQLPGQCRELVRRPSSAEARPVQLAKVSPLRHGDDIMAARSQLDSEATG
jgi:hypothetical protein